MRAEVKSKPTGQSGAIHLSVTFEESDLRLSETPFGVMVELEGCSTRGELGGPGLPSRLIRVALPPFTRAKEVSGKATRTLHIRQEPTMIAPVQSLRPLAKGGEPPQSAGSGQQGEGVVIKASTLRPREEPFVEPFPAPPFVPPRAELYEREARQPRPLARLVATEEIGLVPVALIEIVPVRLVKNGLLDFCPEIEITVSYEQVGAPPESMSVPGEGKSEVPFVRAIQSRAQAQRLMELARAQVVNDELVWDFTPLFPALITHVDYLIITDNHLWNEATITPTGSAGDLVAAFQRLADWKTKRGLKARVVSVSDIVNGVYGGFVAGARDLQEVIRNFLKWAYSAWGISWVLLGGDVSVVPVRRVAGALEGHIAIETTDPPPDNQSYWTGSYLKMKVVNPSTPWPGSRTDHLLVRPDNGLLIPYDAAGTSGPTSRGWYFTSDETYSTRAETPTQFVRVNGPAAEINAQLQWLYEWNMVPTDLYYASLIGPCYDLPGKHDWDLLDNGIYGQHAHNLDFDGVSYQADVSLGRAPVASQAQANAFVDKVIAYEQFRRPDGVALDTNWLQRMLLVSSNFGWSIWVSSTTSSPPGDDQYHHAPGASHTLIKLKDKPGDLQWNLMARSTAADVRVLPYDRNASASGHGWYYARSAMDPSPNETSFSLWGTTMFIPITSQWVMVYGPAEELSPQGYIFDRAEPDDSMHGQEQLRQQVAAELPGINNISRLYEDEVDLTPVEAAAAPLEHLTEERLRNALNAGQHFVSLSGHGDSNGCCWLSGGMAQNLTNAYHGFIGYAYSCLTNQFDAEDAVSERLLYNPNVGAVAYVGYTRFGWPGFDNFERAFFHRLVTTQHLGLLNDVRCSMVNDWADEWAHKKSKWTIFALNLMGDPEMPIWVGTPLAMIVTFPQVVDRRQPFAVQVLGQFKFFHPPLDGATVHIQQGNFSRLAWTDATGNAVFDLNPAQLGELEVTVTHPGYVPNIGKARITGPAWVSGQVTAIFHQHGTAHQTLVRLHLDEPINGEADRGWYARDTLLDYGIILDAVTDAYVSGKKISLYVDNTDEGGTIERFAFEQEVVKLKLPTSDGVATADEILHQVTGEVSDDLKTEVQGFAKSTT